MKNLLTILIISLVGVISIIVIGNTNHQYKQVINKLNNEKISKKITKNEIKNNSSIWLTNFKIAKAESKNRNLPIFILFTGSPWCSGCNKFNTNILNTHKFENFAKKHFILFKADYPFTPVGKKHEQTVAEINQNSYLKYKYDINEFPTVILLNRQEQIIKKLTGYPIVRGTKKYTDLLKKTLNYKSNKNKQINLNSKNTVKITSISPDLNKTLKVGQKVNFFIEVKYSIKNSNYGKISLFIQDKNRTLNPNEKSIILKKGTGVIYICSKIIIPDAKTINLFLPLSGVNKKQANIVAFRTYKVNS